MQSRFINAPSEATKLALTVQQALSVVFKTMEGAYVVVIMFCAHPVLACLV